eukprot:CAMPEP_0171093080 /NCGR_PEP_ID=MMETSP0766_2-20121228/38870_1 /TAXON_ID=439317 /ORGANISM="Gambierdiscus australes, Strain CAWD 149" /LENGTH=87 /DNA_ID=CAMNT_0011551465 /DNA_START=175 /DNA_END=436 /DNA_ORIENTATION=-
MGALAAAAQRTASANCWGRALEHFMLVAPQEIWQLQQKEEDVHLYQRKDAAAEVQRAGGGVLEPFVLTRTEDLALPSAARAHPCKCK